MSDVGNPYKRADTKEIQKITNVNFLALLNKRNSDSEVYLSGPIDNKKVNGTVVIQNLNFATDFSLIYCEFDGLIINNCHFSESLTIDYSKFNGHFEITKSSFGGKVHTFKNKVEGAFAFTENKVQDFVLIDSLTVEEEFRSSYNEIEKYYGLSFIKCNRDIFLSGDSIKGSTYINDGFAYEGYILRELTLGRDLSIEMVRAENSVLAIQDSPTEKLKIAHCSFKKFLLPESVGLKSTFHIIDTKFNRIETSDDFTNQGYMQWNSLEGFGEKPTLCLSNALMGKWDLISCDFENVEFQLYSSKITEAFYTNTKLPDKLSVDKDYVQLTKQHEVLSDGYNQLKTLAQKQNDRKWFLHYQAKELDSYNKTLTWKNSLRTKFQLEAMKLSNCYGVSWSRGIIFTLSATVLFLIITLAYRPIDLSNWKEFIAQGFTFLFKLTSEPDFISGPWEVTWFYISRVFILFGIYQTISAFRKFGKGES